MGEKDPYLGFDQGDADTLVWTLRRPVTLTFRQHGGNERQEQIDSVKLRRANGGDLLIFDQFQAQPMRLMLEAVARLSGLDLDVVKKLDADDLGPLGNAALSRLEGGPAIGGTA